MLSLAGLALASCGFVGFFCIHKFLQLCFNNCIFYFFEQQFRLIYLVTWQVINRLIPVFPLCFSMLRKPRSFSMLNGRNGSRITVRLAVICRQTFKIVFTRSGLVLNSFQGSSSARYLLPRRAKSIAFFNASRKRKLSRLFSTSALMAVMAASVSLSYAVSSPVQAPGRHKYFWVSTSARLTKFPSTATSSLLLRA
jgi:hypothetical protein